jgi:uncharacterized protein YqgC (DUF456 family)
MLDWLLYFVMLLLLLTGIAITFVTLPGLWLMLITAVVYSILTHFHFIAAKTLVALLVLALAGEVVELGYSGRGAKRAGAGRRGLWGAIIGGVIGGFGLSFVIPFGFPISTILGICIGTFAGATLGELSAGQTLGRSALIGLSATTGRVMGTIAKGAIGGVMLVLALWVGLPVHHKASAATVPTSRPLTTNVATPATHP